MDTFIRGDEREQQRAYFSCCMSKSHDGLLSSNLEDKTDEQWPDTDCGTS